MFLIYLFYFSNPAFLLPQVGASPLFPQLGPVLSLCYYVFGARLLADIN